MHRWRSPLAVLSSALLFLALAGCAIDQLHANRAEANIRVATVVADNHIAIIVNHRDKTLR